MPGCPDGEEARLRALEESVVERLLRRSGGTDRFVRPVFHTVLGADTDAVLVARACEWLYLAEGGHASAFVRVTPYGGGASEVYACRPGLLVVMPMQRVEIFYVASSVTSEAGFAWVFYCGRGYEPPVPPALPLAAAGLSLSGVSLSGAHRVVEVPPQNLVTGNVLVGLAATLVVAARPGRRKLLVVRFDTANDVYLGGAGVTTAAGFLLDAVAAPPVVDLGPVAAAVFGITVVADQNVRYWEVF